VARSRFHSLGLRPPGAGDDRLISRGDGGSAGDDDGHRGGGAGGADGDPATATAASPRPRPRQ